MKPRLVVQPCRSERVGQSLGSGGGVGTVRLPARAVLTAQRQHCSVGSNCSRWTARRVGRMILLPPSASGMRTPMSWAPWEGPTIAITPATRDMSRPLSSWTSTRLPSRSAFHSSRIMMIRWLARGPRFRRSQPVQWSRHARCVGDRGSWIPILVADAVQRVVKREQRVVSLIGGQVRCHYPID
jgi:hypothetical protein